MKTIIALLLFTSLCFCQSNVVSNKYTYYEREFVFPSTTKVDPTIYKKIEIKVFKNQAEAVEVGKLGVGDHYALPPVGGKSFIVKIVSIPTPTMAKGSVENTTIYMSKEIKEN